MKFDYTLTPGRVLENQDKIKNQEKPTISIVTPFYSGHDYIEQTARCVLNQTYPYFEWLIISDGKKDKKTVDVLTKIASLDKRIRIIYKENTGPAATRDYGVNETNPETEYLFFLDDDDLIDKTYLECAYWTLETNKGASFAYTDSIGFGTVNYLWSKWFNIKEERKQNILVETSLIRKKDFLEIGGYNLKEKGINEDWIFWLKLFTYGKYPVRMSYYGFWYRRKDQGELSTSKQKENLRLTKELMKRHVKKSKLPIEAIQYPRSNYDYSEVFNSSIKDFTLPKYSKNSKTKILMIIPWITMGGADKFNIDLISKLDKEKYEVIVVTTEPQINTWRQKLEQNAKIVYDLTSFLDRKYWHLFIKNLIESRNIDIIFNTNSSCGYEMLPYLKSQFPNIKIMDYIHMEEWYNRNGGYSRDSSAVASVIDRTLTCNKKSQEILCEYFKRDNNKLNTVYIGVDEEKFKKEHYNRDELRNKYQINKDAFIINFICRIDYQKRPFLFIEIMKELYTRDSSFICVVAGDGQLLNKLKALTSKYKLSNNIKFLGAIKNVQEIYAISDLSLNCSIKEGLALTSYESLSMGVPVLTSDVGGQSELVDDKVGAVVPCLQKEEDIKNFDYSKEEINEYVDKIIKIKNNIEYYKNNSRKKILSGFTINHMIENMTQEFENLMKITPKNTLKENKDIYLELINQYYLGYSEIYEYFCEEFNCNTFHSRTYKKGWTTSKFKLRLIRFVQKIGVEEEAKLLKDSLKNILKIFKIIGKKIAKLLRVGSE